MIDFMGVPISLINASGWGAFALLAWVIIRSVIRGHLRTAREVEDLRKDRDARLQEVGKWRLAWEERGTVVTEVLTQNTKLLDHLELTTRVVKAARADQDPGAGTEVGDHV